jgi:hypothetical protein
VTKVLLANRPGTLRIVSLVSGWKRISLFRSSAGYRKTSVGRRLNKRKWTPYPRKDLRIFKIDIDLSFIKMYYCNIHFNGGQVMEASVVDLRYKMKDVLAALERREVIRIMYHGQVKGTIIPVAGTRKEKMANHPFFGLRKGEPTSVPELMDVLRGGRYDSL